jgi:hypothetical protein
MSFFEIVLGGDQPKWQVGRVNSVTFSGQLRKTSSLIVYVFGCYSLDLAENSVEDCKQRYRERRCSYKANFFPLDCTKVCF